MIVSRGLGLNNTSDLPIVTGGYGLYEVGVVIEETGGGGMPLIDLERALDDDRVLMRTIEEFMNQVAKRGRH